MRQILEELLAEEGFRSLAIIMNAGTRHEVSNPSLAVWGRDVLYIYHSRTDQYDVIRLAEISVIEVFGSAV